MGLFVTDAACCSRQPLQVGVQGAARSDACWQLIVYIDALGPLRLVPQLLKLAGIAGPIRRLRIPPMCYDHL